MTTTDWLPDEIKRQSATTRLIYKALTDAETSRLTIQELHQRTGASVATIRRASNDLIDTDLVRDGYHDDDPRERFLELTTQNER